MTVSIDVLLETIEQIYAAPFEDNGWREAMRSISKLLGAEAATYSGSFVTSSAYRPSFLFHDSENHVAIYAGVPAANRAFKRVKQTYAEMGITFDESGEKPA